MNIKDRAKSIEEALAHPRAKILVHAPPRCDYSGNSRARQTVFTTKGDIIWTDNRTRSYWYAIQNERRAFEARGGLVLTA